MVIEEKITIIIDKKGKIEVKTLGIKGKKCIDEIEVLLGGIVDIERIKKLMNIMKTKL